MKASRLHSAKLCLLLSPPPRSALPREENQLCSPTAAVKRRLWRDNGSLYACASNSQAPRADSVQQALPSPPRLGGNRDASVTGRKGGAAQGKRAACRCMKGALVWCLQNSQGAKATDSRTVPLGTGGAAPNHTAPEPGWATGCETKFGSWARGLKKDSCLQPCYSRAQLQHLEGRRSNASPELRRP